MPAAETRLSAVLLAVLAFAGCEPSSPSVPVAKAENIVIAVDKDGNFYWNDERVTCAEMSAKMAAMSPQAVDAPKIDFCETPSQPAP